MKVNTSNSLNLLIIFLTYIITQTLATNTNRLKLMAANNSNSHLLNQKRTFGTNDQNNGAPSKIYSYQQQQQQQQQQQSEYIKSSHQQTNLYTNSKSNNMELNNIALTPASFTTTKSKDSPALSLKDYKTNDDHNKLFNHLNTAVNEDDSLKIPNEISKEAIQSSASAIAVAVATGTVAPPATTTTTTLTNPFSNSATYPWNLYQPKYAQQPLNYLPPPDTIPAMFTNILPTYNAIRRLLAVTPRILPLITYTHSMYVPYSVYLNSEMLTKNRYSNLLPAAAGDANLKVPVSRSSDAFAPVTRTYKDYTTTSNEHNNNSPIYYVRIRPTPYIFLPTNPAVWPENIQPPLVSFGRMLNVPVSFVANGKPTGIYQIDNLSNDIETELHVNDLTESNHNTQTSTNLNSLIPTISKNQYSEAAAQNIDDHLKDSELITLKYTYYFNGRPDNIYVLSNNLLPRYSTENDNFY